VDDWELRPARDHGLSFLERLRSVSREDGLPAAGIRHAWWWLVRCHLAVWHRLTVHHPENLPRTFPFVLIANHSSHLDALVLTAALPWHLRAGTCPLAAGDVFFESPFRGALAAGLLNALPVWRRRHSGRSFQELRRRLLEGDCGYVLFPEGTRSRDGRMTPFKPGVGMLVTSTAVPVVPCYLDGCYAAFSPGSAIPHRQRIRLHVGPPLRFNGLGNDRVGWETTASALEEAVRSQRTRAKIPVFRDRRR
jgi:1-acyl-sn-glycerol-3-phosphate acyltransferase